MKICVSNKTKSFLFDFSADIYIVTFMFHLSPAVSKKNTPLIFSWKQRDLVAYIGEENKSIKLQTLREEKLNCHLCLDCTDCTIVHN